MSARLSGIHHVQLAAPPGCEPEARAFFGDLLGLAELAKPELFRARGGVWFACGQQQLHVGVEEGFSPPRKAHPAFAVESLGDLRGRLERAGVETRPDADIAGARRFHTSDPFGNRLEFVEAA